MTDLDVLRREDPAEAEKIAAQLEAGKISVKTAEHMARRKLRDLRG